MPLITFVYTSNSSKCIYQCDVPISKLKSDSIKEINVGILDALENELIDQALSPVVKIAFSNNRRLVCELISKLSGYINYSPIEYAFIMNHLPLPSSDIFRSWELWMESFIIHVLFSLYGDIEKFQSFSSHLNSETKQTLHSIIEKRYQNNQSFHNLWFFCFFNQKNNMNILYSHPLTHRLSPLPQLNNAEQIILSSQPSLTIELQQFRLCNTMKINDETVYAVVSGQSLIQGNGIIDYLIIGSNKSAKIFLYQNGITDIHKTLNYSETWINCETFIDGSDRFIITNEKSVDKIVSKYPIWFQVFIDFNKSLLWSKSFAFARTIGVSIQSDKIHTINIDDLGELGYNIIVLKKVPSLLDYFYELLTYYCSWWIRVND